MNNAQTRARAGIFGALRLGSEGFTLIEAVIGVAFVGVLGLAASEGLVMFSRSNKRLADKAAKNLDTRAFSQAFIQNIEAASASTQFVHMPVPINNCGNDAKADDPLNNLPCVRSLGKNNTFSSIDPAAFRNDFNDSTLSSVEFFRDHKGVIKLDRPAFTSKSTAMLKGTTPLQLTAQNASGYNYVTWPLADDKAIPFTLVRNGGNGEFFIFESAFKFSTISGINIPHRWAFFKASSAKQTAADIKGHILLLYNNYNVDHHMFQLVKDVKQCTDTQTSGTTAVSVCTTLAYDWYPSDRNKVKNDWDATFRNANNHYFALELVPVTEALGNRFMNDFQPPRAQMEQGGRLNVTNWGPDQLSDFYFFATEVSTVHDTATPIKADFDPTRRADIRTIVHYFTEPSTRPEGAPMPVFLGVKVRVMTYYLKANGVVTEKGPNGKDLTRTKYALMSRTYHEGPTSAAENENKLIEEIPGKVVFARRIGTPTFNLFMYRPSSSLAGAGGAFELHQAAPGRYLMPSVWTNPGEPESWLASIFGGNDVWVF